MSKVHITQFEDDGNSLIEKAREVCKQFNASDNEEEKEDLLLKVPHNYNVIKAMDRIFIYDKTKFGSTPSYRLSTIYIRQI